MVETENQEKQPAFSVVTAEEFAATDFEAAIKNKQLVNLHPLMRDFAEAAHSSHASGQHEAARVFNLLQALSGIHWTPEDRARTWGPLFVLENGTRSSIPSDFIGEQTTVLAGIVPGIQHAPLRARLADIAWTNSKKRADIATFAVDAYCECAEGVLAGVMVSEYQKEEKVPLEAVRLVRRALQISYATSKRGALPDRVKNIFRRLYESARDAAALVVFKQAAEAGLYYELATRSEVANDAVSVARRTDNKYPFAVRPLYEIAAQLFERLGDEDAKRRCQLAAVDQILLMRKQVSGAGAEAHWVMEALQALRHVKGVEQQEEALELDLRRLQRASLKQMAAIPIDLDVAQHRDYIEKRFSEMSLKDALMHFALLTDSPSVEYLKAEALKIRESAPLVSMMGASLLDSDGKAIRITSGSDGRSEPLEDWYRHTIDRFEQIRRLQAVSGAIDPARVVTNIRFSIEERHIEPVVSASAFAPAEQKPILTLGFARFFQGDMMSAAHLVIPQLEPCLRYGLKMSAVSAIRRFDDGTEEDRDLKAMLLHNRAHLEQSLTPALTAEIERLFHSRPGPALRHEFAHGLASAGECFGPNTIFGVWLMYRITWLMAAQNWQLVEPILDAIENA